MLNVNIDFMSKNGVQGDVANMINQGKVDPGEMRPWMGSNGKPYVTVHTGGDRNNPKNYRSYQVDAAGLNLNGTLRREEWQQLDSVLIPIAESRLNGIQDLITRGLTFNLGNAMGTTVLEWEDLSDAMEAVMTMDGVTRGQGDRPVYTSKYLPIPIIHADYEINARALAASRNSGNPLDTTSVERATRHVADFLEQMLFVTAPYTFGGGTIYSYTNYLHRNTTVLASKWTNSGVTGKMIVDDVLSMKADSIAAYHYGPWMLYIPSAYETLLDEDYSDAKGSNTIRERIKQIANIIDVKVVDTLTADNVLLVQMTSDTVRLVRGMGIQNVQWDTEGKFITKYKVLTIQVPQIRSDQEGRCGIVHATFAA